MKALFISSALLFVASSAIAAERAVEAIHYEADVNGNYYDTDTDGANGPGRSQILLFELRSAITLPLGESFGASLEGAYTKSEGESTVVFTSIDSDTNEFYGTAKVFYRNPDFGRVSFGYQYQSIDFTYSINGGQSVSNTNTFYNYIGLIEGYVGPVTLGVNDIRSDSSNDSIYAIASWYVTANVRVGAQIGLEDAEGLYRAEVEFQPAFLHNSGGFYARYIGVDGDAITGNSIGIGFNFYFDRRFDLITRDRHYR